MAPKNTSLKLPHKDNLTSLSAWEQPPHYNLRRGDRFLHREVRTPSLWRNRLFLSRWCTVPLENFYAVARHRIKDGVLLAPRRDYDRREDEGRDRETEVDPLDLVGRDPDEQHDWRGPQEDELNGTGRKETERHILGRNATKENERKRHETERNGTERTSIGQNQVRQV